jgi:hypothetical protein
MTTRETLFRVQKARVKITWQHRSVATINMFHQRIIVLVESIDNKRLELLIPKRLSNGGERVSQTFNLVEEGRD